MSDEDGQSEHGNEKAHFQGKKKFAFQHKFESIARDLWESKLRPFANVGGNGFVRVINADTEYNSATDFQSDLSGGISAVDGNLKMACRVDYGQRPAGLEPLVRLAQSRNSCFAQDDRNAVGWPALEQLCAKIRPPFPKSNGFKKPER